MLDALVRDAPRTLFRDTPRTETGAKSRDVPRNKGGSGWG